MAHKGNAEFSGTSHVTDLVGLSAVKAIKIEHTNKERKMQGTFSK